MIQKNKVFKRILKWNKWEHKIKNVSENHLGMLNRKIQKDVQANLLNIEIWMNKRLMKLDKHQSNKR